MEVREGKSQSKRVEDFVLLDRKGVEQKRAMLII